MKYDNYYSREEPLIARQEALISQQEPLISQQEPLISQEKAILHDLQLKLDAKIRVFSERRYFSAIICISKLISDKTMVIDGKVIIFASFKYDIIYNNN